MDKKGFTLMEVMVTLVVFSIVMLTLFSSFQAFVSSGDAITRGIHEAERARTALERMGEDLEQVHVIQPPRYGVSAFDAPPDPFRMAGSRTRVGGAVFSRLEFTTFSRVIAGPEEARGISKITYYVRQNPDKGFDLCRSDREPGTPGEEDPCRDPVLMEEIQAFDIEYTDSREETGTDWDSDSDDTGHALPVSLRMTLKTGDPTGVFETAVFLPVARGPLE
ncbi:MAG: prepilin-type N-terminal cleavage/methylation domain-containing protein [Desulfobacula sp.]|nr:prepilin-type N-terminal cleavage/methylation domain-containing protein [Desulfobacula sp.]